MFDPSSAVAERFNRSNWAVRRFYSYGQFPEIWRALYSVTIGREEEELRGYLVKNARERGIEAYRDNKTAFEVEGVDGRVMVWCFYDNGLYVIPVSD